MFSKSLLLDQENERWAAVVEFPRLASYLISELSSIHWFDTADSDTGRHQITKSPTFINPKGSLFGDLASKLPPITFILVTFSRLTWNSWFSPQLIFVTNCLSRMQAHSDLWGSAQTLHRGIYKVTHSPGGTTRLGVESDVYRYLVADGCVIFTGATWSHCVPLWGVQGAWQRKLWSSHSRVWPQERHRRRTQDGPQRETVSPAGTGRDTHPRPPPQGFVHSKADVKSA